MEVSLLYKTPETQDPSLTHIAVDSRNKRIACGSIDANILLLSTKNGRLQRTLNGHEGVISSIVFVENGSRIITGSWDCTARTWFVTKGTLDDQSLSHTSEIKSLQIHEESTKGLAGTRDGIVKIFTLKNLKCLRNLEAHQRDVSGVQFTSDGSQFISSSWDGTIKLWNSTSYEQEKYILRQKHRIRTMSLTPDDTTVFAGLHNGMVLAVSLENTRNKSEIRAHSDVVSSIAIDPTGLYLATASWDRKLKIWDIEKRTKIKEGKASTGISSLVWNPDGSQVYTTDFSGMVQIWDTGLTE